MLFIIFSLVITVDTTGLEGESLQIAIDSLSNIPGIDTVFLMPGKYHLNINPDPYGYQGLLMKAKTVLMSMNAESCTLTASSESGLDTAKHVIFDNYESLDTIVVKNLTIMDGRTNPYEGGGISFYNVSGVTVDSCIFANCNGWASAVIYGENAKISGNIFQHNSSDKAVLYFCGVHSEIFNNFVDSNIGSGIYLEGCINVTLHNNTIKNNCNNGIWIVGSDSISSHGDTIAENRSCLTKNILKQTIVGYGAHIENTTVSFENCAFIHNHADNFFSTGGGNIGIGDNSNVDIKKSIIKEGGVENDGGGIYISNSNLYLANVLIEENHSFNGGAIFLTDTAYVGIKKSILRVNYGVNNTFFVENSSNLSIEKCVIMSNFSDSNKTVIFDTLHSKVGIDSSFIVDNSNYILRLAGDGDSIRVNNSNIYYNTFQQDTEIYNNSSISMNIKNNFWWVKTDGEISSIIYGPNNHSGFYTDFIPGVPGEPLSVDSVVNYDSIYSNKIDTLWSPGKLYLRYYGMDRNPDITEAAIVIVSSDIYPTGISVALSETDTNSGIYEGEVQVAENRNSSNIFDDDVFNLIRADSTGDNIHIKPNIDTTIDCIVYYKTGSGIKERDFYIHPINKISRGRIKFELFLLKSTNIKMDIFDITGRVIKRVNRRYSSGSHTIAIKLEKSGVYFYKIKFNREIINGKFILLK